jgi:dTDP-3-amino-3,4,6-trideoxy-alpha-D-glucose transaminase
MGAIMDIAREHGLRVVEDAAQAHGAEIGGRRAGTLADAAAFSFYPTKNLGALGDGGAVTTEDPEVAERVRLARNYGYRRRDDAEMPGRNSRLDELQAAVLTLRLHHLDAENERRRELAAAYLDGLAECGGLTLPAEAPGRRHAWHLFVVRATDRDGLQARLAGSGVQALSHYPRPIHGQPAYAGLARPGELSNSERLCAEVLSLPLHPALTDDEQGAVIDAVRSSASVSRA